MTKHEAANLLQGIVDSRAEYIKLHARTVDALILAVGALKGYSIYYQPDPEEHTGCTADACPIEGVEQD